MKDTGPDWTSTWGVTNAPVTSSDLSGAAAAVTAAPTSGQRLVIDDIVVSSAAALLITFTEETSGTVMFKIRSNTVSTQITPRGKRILATADKKLFAQTSGAGAVEILVGYHSE